MKAIKRTVAALLATLMLATSTSFTLAAENYNDKEAVVVAKVNGAGIMTGTDKGFEPSKSLTRAEAAAIIVRMKGISESAVKSMAGTTLFKDVAAAHWASGYVNEASNLGIVKGVSATEFAPDREVTVAEFVTMAIRALGAGQLVDSEGVWPTNYVNFANENDLLKDVTAIYTATASRMNAATIVANTIESKMWTKDQVDTTGKITFKKSNTTILKDTLKIDVTEDVRISIDDVKDRLMSVTYNDTHTNYSDALYTREDVAECVDLATLKEGMAYDIWYNTDTKEIVALFKAEHSKEKTYAFTEVKKLTGSVIKVVIDGKEEEYDLDTNVEYSYNGSTLNTTAITLWDGVSAKGTKEILDKESTFGTIVVENNKVTKIYAEEYRYAGLVDEVTSTKIKFDSLAISNALTNAETIKLNDDDLTFYVEKDGKEISINDVKEDDVVFYYADGDEYHISIVNSSVEGEITSKGTTYVKVDGKKYTVSSHLTISADAEDEVALYLNAAGKVVMYDSIDDNGNFAVIKSIEAVTGRKGVDYEVVLAYADGTTSDTLTVDLDKTKEDNEMSLSTEAAVRAFLEGDTAGATATAANANIKANSIAGSVIEYRISGDKLVIIDNDNADIVPLTEATLTVGRSKSYVTKSSVNYWFTSSTKFLSKKAYSDDPDDNYRIKVVSVDIEDLKSDNDVDVILVDLDTDNNVDLVIFDDTTITRDTVSEDWYFVLDTATTKEDYDLEVIVTDVNGNEKTYYTDESIHAGDFGLISVSGDVLTEELDKDGKYAKLASDLTNTYFKEIKDGVLKLSAVAVADDKYTETVTSKGVLADEVLFVKVKDGEYSVGRESALDELSDLLQNDASKKAQNEEFVDDATEVVNYITYTKDNATEIVAIIYK